MSSYDIPEDYEELKGWVRSKEEEQSEFASQLPKLSNEIQSVLTEEQALVKQVNEFVRKRRQLESQRDLIKRQVKADQTAIAQGKRKLETFTSERAIEERLKRESEEFDKITQHYRWREWAFEHQIDGAKRLASARRGILGDKRGLGKSLTSLIWADMIGSKRIIVFAPKDVLGNFKREIEHWTPHRNVSIVSGLSKVQREMFLKLLRSQGQFLILVNYEAWRRDAELIEYLKYLKVDSVIIDEAHNIKEQRTSAYKGIRDIVYAENCCNHCGGDPEYYKDPISGKSIIRCSECLHEPQKFGDFCSVKNVLPMTGTTILNRPQDLWTLLNLVDRELFPRTNDFLQDYCIVDQYTSRWRFRYGGEEALVKKLGSRFVRRDKRTLEAAGVRLKKQVIVPHRIEFDKALYPDQWRVMQQIAEFGAIKMAENVKLDIIGILPELLRRRQAITWPRGIKIWEYDDNGNKTGRVKYEAPVTESIKMDKAMEIAKEIIFEEEDRLVIFSQFKEALKEFERRFIDLNVSVVRYDGDISDNKAQEAQLDFDGKTAANHPWGTDCNSECKYWGSNCYGYKWQVILAHYKKGGVSLNLNAANQMIILDREWNPGKEDQAQGRIDRMDNISDSIAHTIHVENTIDSFMDELIDAKRDMIEGFEQQQDMLEKMINALKDGDLM